MYQIDEVLKNIGEEELQNLIEEIKKTHEYDVLKDKTPIKNSVVEDDFHDENLTDRQTHSFQVSKIAYQIVKESGRSEKEALVAQLVGLCHDLGHTPFGHDGEVFFSEKTGKPFYHAKYGAKIFDKVFKEVLNSKNPKSGKDTFGKETKESLEELQTFVKAGIFSEEIIQNLIGLGDYIKSGVNFHQDGYYTFEMDRKLEELRNEYKETGKYNEELELLEKALNNPCIYAGMIADSEAFRQSDNRDMMNAKNPFDETKTIISIDDQMRIAKNIGFTNDDILKMQEQLLLAGKNVNIERLDENESLLKILENLGNTSVVQIQKVMAINIGKNGLNDKGRFESISDEYKILADDCKTKYEQFKGIELTKEEWEKTKQTELPKQRQLLKEKNPLLCLTYEIQNELMYNEIIYGDKIKLLNNDVERNRAIFSRVYDYLYKVTSKPSSELRIDELEDKVQMMQLRKEGNYPKQFKEKNKDGLVNKKAIVTNLVIFRMQQMGNKDLKDFYNERIANKEKSLEIEIDTLEKEGKNDDEIINILQGIDVEEYSEFKEDDTKKKEKVAEFQKQSKQEISSKLKLEKRDIDEIQEGKSTLSRNLEYNMTYDEIEQINENIGNIEPENKSDMASYEWSNTMSEGESFEVGMEKLVRYALGYMNITAEDVKTVEKAEEIIRNPDKEKEGVNQR